MASIFGRLPTEIMAQDMETLQAVADLNDGRDAGNDEMKRSKA